MIADARQKTTPVSRRPRRTVIDLTEISLPENTAKGQPRFRSNNAGTAVTLSGTFTDAPAMNSDLVDDFVVQGYAWIVRWIDVDGAYFNGPGPANTFTVYFYSDNDGFPGN